MKTNKLSIPPPCHPTWNRYEDYLRSEVHEIIALGFAAARKRITASLHEEVITQYIAESIQGIFNSSQAPDFVDNYNLKEESPINHTHHLGKNRKKTDLVIEHQHAGLRPRPWFIFESKRLKTPSNTVAKYCGNSGIERFVDCRYASAYPEAGMLAYVQSDDIKTWETRLLSKLKKSKKLFLKLPVSRVNIVKMFTDEWHTRHHRLNGQSIDIYHILLDCR